jgi:hypothetical protein
MDSQPKSLASHIEELARLTPVRPHFVDRVRRLFLEKGVPLEVDGGPFRTALEEAFEREAAMLRNRRAAEDGLRRVQQDLRRIGEELERPLARLRSLQGDSDASVASGEERAASVSADSDSNGESSGDGHFETRSLSQSVEVDPGAFTGTQ